MSDSVDLGDSVDLVGHCGKISKDGSLCYPAMEDDLCPGCPLNGYESEELEAEDPTEDDCYEDDPPSPSRIFEQGEMTNG